MRPLTLQAVVSLAVLAAAPWLGGGSRTHAGLITVESQSSCVTSTIPDSDYPRNDFWVVAEDEPGLPHMQQASDLEIAQAGEDTLLGLMRDLDGVGLLRLFLPGTPEAPITELPRAQPRHPVCLGDRPEVPPAGLASLFLSGPRSQLPEALLSRLFRPPR